MKVLQFDYLGRSFAVELDTKDNIIHTLLDIHSLDWDAMETENEKNNFLAVQKYLTDEGYFIQ